MAPATTAMPTSPVDNSTESGGAGEGKEDVFAMLKERFFNEIVKLPRECPCVLGGQTAVGSPNIWALGWIIWRSPSGPGVVGLAEGSVTNEQGVYVPSPPWAECPYNLEDSKGEI